MGFLLLQLANFTSAAGQVLYKHLVARHPSDLPHYRRFGYLYLSVLAVALPAFLLFGKQNFLPEAPPQWGGAGVSRPGIDRVGVVLAEQGRVPGEWRDPGGDEQLACAGGVAGSIC